MSQTYRALKKVPATYTTVREILQYTCVKYSRHIVDESTRKLSQISSIRRIKKKKKKEIEFYDTEAGEFERFLKGLIYLKRAVVDVGSNIVIDELSRLRNPNKSNV